MLEHLPYDFLSQTFAGYEVGAINRAKYITIHYVCSRGPGVDSHLHPARYWGSANAAVLPLEIHDAPAAVPLLDMLERECCHLRPPEAAAEEDGEDGAIAQTLG